MRIGPVMETGLLHACLAALCRVLGPTPFVKLRSHCNARPLPLLEATSGTRPILLFRRMAPWALSRHRTFGEPPESVAATLRHALDAADKLFGAAPPPRVLWFEDLRANPLGALRACLPDLRLDPLAIAQVMAADSQAGTALGRDRVPSVAPAPDFGVAFAAAWDNARDGAEWGPATLRLLADMTAPETKCQAAIIRPNFRSTH
jgi:hypothetical protein